MEIYYKVMTKRTFTIGILVGMFLFLVCWPQKNTLATLDWPEPTRESRPWTRWWWLGNAVDTTNISRLLGQYARAGLGGVEIAPIYGVHGYEDRFLDFLSSQWMDMLAHTVRAADRLDMGVDLTNGTGWPFGGPHVTDEYAAAKVSIKTFTVGSGQSAALSLDQGRLLALMAYSGKGAILDLTARVDSVGRLAWSAPAGHWTLYAVMQQGTGQRVKRAAPGGAGKVLDHFSHEALTHYLTPFDGAFNRYDTPLPRAFFNDSFEVYSANWTNDFFDQFRLRRGYDLRHHLSALLGEGDGDTVGRVKSDYRETLSDMLLERFTRPWVAWAHARGSLARNQAHGSPGNLLDLYAAVDIPETEIFGPSGFPIPGLKKDPNFDNEPPDPLILKFASSAAHIAGKPFASSESATWLGEHFQVALSQVKPEIDQLFAAGINHVFYHGIAYSPAEAPWPGWLFYASVNFGPTNTFWRDFPALNEYITRCQSVLQMGRPDHDILLYFPIHDVWHRPEGLENRLEVHNLDRWFHGTPFHEVATYLWKQGYTFDYVSDRQLADVRVKGGLVHTGSGAYQTIIVPRVDHLPLSTLEHLTALAREGATVIFHGQLPADVPGWGRLAERRQRFRQVLDRIGEGETVAPAVQETTLGRGRLLVGDDLEHLLNQSDIRREPLVDVGLVFTRRAFQDRYHYFLANLTAEPVESWVPLSLPATSIVMMDPLTGAVGVAALRTGSHGSPEVYLQLAPGQSIFLRLLPDREVDGPVWVYRQAKPDQAVPLDGPWEVDFIAGGPTLPAGRQLGPLVSWTQLGDDEARRFAGTAHYRLTFEKPALAADDWLLDLGDVRESARVTLNGRAVGTLWSLPFKTPVGRYLVDGENTLELEVTNLAANRIADMDRRGVDWKIFYNTNIVNINYRPFDASDWPPMPSGLLGPVRLVPVQLASEAQ